MGRWASPDIIAAALTGDESAAEQLVAAVWPGCFRLAATVIGDPSLAQDAAQEACVIVLRKIRGLRNADAFDAWLYRVVMREAARVRRRHATVAAHQTFEHVFERDDTASVDVRNALASLPPDLRDVIVLFYFNDLKSEEIAPILGIAHATVRTRLARARERLRGPLDGYRNAQLSQRSEEQPHAT
jgi:RNA polymerase sigma-70 factor (ECF subfamily)